MREILPGTAVVRPTMACAALLVAGAIVATGLSGAAQPAAAQQGFGNYFGYQTQTRKKRRRVYRRQPTSQQEPADKKAEAEQQKPKGPVYAVVSLGDQSISVYDRTGRIARSGVSTGTRGHRTPMGVFSVVQKRRYHRSNLYGSAPMPWMQRITWSGVAMHAGHVPGYPASHGCIRLPYSFAPKMWRLTKMGARVVVARRDTVPFDITHDLLPLPKMQPAPAAPANQQAALPSHSRVELASLEAPTRVAVSNAAVEEDDEPALSGPLNPIAFADALKARAKADKSAADEAAKVALKAAQAAGAEARQAETDLKTAEADLQAAEANLAKLEAQAAKGEALDAKAAEAAGTARTAARSELARARAALEEAHRRQAIKTPAAFAAVQTWKDAVAASDDAAKTVKEAERRSEPVSVFISKKERRIFVRQDWKSVYEAPITIRDPDRPLGTHVFIAVEAEPDGSAVRWSAITVPEKPADAEQDKRAVKKAPVVPIAKTAADEAPPAPELKIQNAAAAALDRIELPAEARRRISELLWTGASLIVSDHPRSYEMGDYTDFIVLTQ